MTESLKLIIGIKIFLESLSWHVTVCSSGRCAKRCHQPPSISAPTHHPDRCLRLRRPPLLRRCHLHHQAKVKEEDGHQRGRLERWQGGASQGVQGRRMCCVWASDTCDKCAACCSTQPWLGTHTGRHHVCGQWVARIRGNNSITRKSWHLSYQWSIIMPFRVRYLSGKLVFHIFWQ